MRDERPLCVTSCPTDQLGVQVTSRCSFYAYTFHCLPVCQKMFLYFLYFILQGKGTLPFCRVVAETLVSRLMLWRVEKDDDHQHGCILFFITSLDPCSGFFYCVLEITHEKKSCTAPPPPPPPPPPPHENLGSCGKQILYSNRYTPFGMDLNKVVVY